MAKVEAISSEPHRLLGCFLVFATTILFVLVSYSRFTPYHGTYLPLFNSALGIVDYSRDIVLSDHFLLSIALPYYWFIGLFNQVAELIDPFFVYAIFYISNSLLNLWLAYKIGVALGNKLGALVFVIVLFSPFEVFKGADVSIIFNKSSLSPTAFATTFGFYTVLSLLKKRYLQSYIGLSFIFFLNIKLAFAIGLPMVGLLACNYLGDKTNRSNITLAFLKFSPVVILLVAYLIVGVEAGFSCQDLVARMIVREEEESDVLKSIFVLGSRPYYLLFFVVLVIPRFWKLPSSEVYTQLRILIISSFLGLCVGSVISFTYGYFGALENLMLFAWPKLAFIPTILGVAILSNNIANRSENFNSGNLVVRFLYLVLTFLSLLYVDLFDPKHQDLTYLLLGVILVFSLGYTVVTRIDSSKSLPFKPILVTLIISFISIQMSIRTFNAYNIFKEGEESEWGGGLLRIPSQFDRAEWALSVWLNKTVKDGDLILFPDYSGVAIDEPKFHQIRRFSTRSWYVTSDIFDAYGPNCLRLEDVNRRNIRARRWLSGLPGESIANEGVKWVIIREDDIGKVPVLFKFRERYEVYNHIVFHI